MRNLLATLSVLAALGATAGTAVADNPSATYTGWGTIGLVGTTGMKCQTPFSHGVLGQYGAWGLYIDGCTVRLTCPSYARYCRATSHTTIDTYMHRGARVTMNARLRLFDGAGNAYWWRDRSCADVNTCATDDVVYFSSGQAASIQCNGVMEPSHNLGSDACSLEVTKF